jgi:hypothetical protein
VEQQPNPAGRLSALYAGALLMSDFNRKEHMTDPSNWTWDDERSTWWEGP